MISWSNNDMKPYENNLVVKMNDKPGCSSVRGARGSLIPFTQGPCLLANAATISRNWERERMAGKSVQLSTIGDEPF
jgi:hypothetical protein